ncbi:F-box only protein 15-like isoform X2 [Channa argus]|uniref:F-box only protein 15-like isoform X2 n=1 Tax=Channa argus TaxID=215402 RepID=UPI003520E17C
MAAGRGEFFQSLLAGLERKPTVSPQTGRQQGHGGGKPGHGRGLPGAGRGPPNPNGAQACRRRKKRGPKAAPSSISMNERSSQDPVTGKKKAGHLKVKPSVCEKNFVERLPSEIKAKILSYLDASSLVSISHVSKHFYQLANDDVMWQKIYMSDFGSQIWKPKLNDGAVEEDPREVEDETVGHWKKMYFRAVAGPEVIKWKRELRHISLYTGLPIQTEWVLRNLNVCWHLTVCDCWGQETMLQQSRAYFFESSVIVCWSGSSFPNYHDINSIQLHGVRKETPKSPKAKKPGWRSLILNLDAKAQPGRFIGRDRLIKLMLLPSGVMIGIWRGQNRVAFIVVSLHFHKLVEKSLLGSSSCPYFEPVDRPPVDNSDPEFGLHGYTLHFVLHTTGTEIMSGGFCNLSWHPAQIQRGLMELRVIERTNFSQHRLLSGNIKLPWKSEVLEGTVENCCIMTLTLLDNFWKPFWCVSSPITIKMSKQPVSFDYDGYRRMLGPGSL